jgi:hypothetical protein
MIGGRQGGWRMGCAVAAAIGLGLILLALLGAHLYDRMWGRRLEAKLREYREAGEPVTWLEVLAARAQIPHEENAAYDLLDAFDRIEEETPPADRLLQYVVPMTPLGWRNSDAVLEVARARREAHDELAGLIGAAGAGDRVSLFPAEPEVRPVEWVQLHLGKIREAAHLLSVHAACLAQSGDTAASARALLGGAVLPASLGAPPTLIDAYLRIAAGAIWVGGVERVLGLCELPPTDLRALREACFREDGCSFLVDALIGQRAYQHETIEWLFSPDALESEWGAELACMRWLALVPGLKEKSEISSLEMLTDAGRIARMPMPARLAEARRLDDPSGQGGGGMRVGVALLLDLCIGRTRPIDHDLRNHARLRNAAAALAVEQWRLAHGAWPESLDALVPEMLDAVPEDPFTGAPLGYLPREDGVIIYSAGPDGWDDGGMDQVLDANGEIPDEGWDMLFRLLNPDLRGAHTMAPRDELMRVQGGLNAKDLAQIGFPLKRLLELGLTDEDIWQLRY